ANGELKIEAPAAEPANGRWGGNGRRGNGFGTQPSTSIVPPWEVRSPRPAPPVRGPAATAPQPEARSLPAPVSNNGALQTIRVYAYGLARNRLEQAAKRLRLPAIVTDDIEDAQALVTLKTYYRRHQKIVGDAEERGLPIYVLRANTVNQMENFLS